MTEKILIIGDYNWLKITRRNGRSYILDSSEGEIILIDNTYEIEMEVGEEVEVFVLPTAEDTLIATILTPYAVVGEFACMMAIDSNTFGTYLDWGIEKDLFVYHKDQRRIMVKGKKYVVYVQYDENRRRIRGTSFLEHYFDMDISDLRKEEKVSLLIYDITEIGIMAVVNGRHSGMLYINECFEKIAIGDIRHGYIKKKREDGKLDLTLQPGINTAIHNYKKTVFKKLTFQQDGFLPFNDKSDPEEIKKTFSMSKKNFKRAIGSLYKDKSIYITAKGIYLVDSRL